MSASVYFVELEFFFFKFFFFVRVSFLSLSHFLLFLLSLSPRLLLSPDVEEQDLLEVVRWTVEKRGERWTSGLGEVVECRVGLW